MHKSIDSPIAKIIFCLPVIFILLFSKVHAGDPEYFTPVKSKPFLFTLGIGYGIANNPSFSTSEKKNLAGLTISGNLGYQISKRFSIDFGPMIWIESQDLFQNNVPSGERPANKRMLVSFNGYYLLNKKVPFTLKVGGGIGSMVYSPKRKTIAIDGEQRTPTEFLSGPAGTLGIIYKLKIGQKITIHPSLNFLYSDLNKQKIEYQSGVDVQKPSIITDLRIQFFLRF